MNWQKRQVNGWGCRGVDPARRWRGRRFKVGRLNEIERGLSRLGGFTRILKTLFVLSARIRTIREIRVLFILPHRKIMQTLLKELKKLAIQNGDGIYGDLDLALADIDTILSAKDIAEKQRNVKLLIAPTSNLQDLSIDRGWGEEFLLLADKIEQELRSEL